MACRRLLVLLLGLLCLAMPASAGAHAGHDHPEPDHIDTIREVNVDFAGLVEQGEQSAPAALGDTILPTTHCDANNGAGDDTANAAYPAAHRQFKFVYAYVAGAPNRYAQWRDALQANVSLISRFMASESGGRKTPRFDMGTTCGPDFVDIQVVALPETAAFYDYDFERVRAAVRGIVGGTHNLVVLADGMNASRGLGGQGSIYLTHSRADVERAANIHNEGSMTSIIWVPNATTPPADPANGFWPEGFLHEMAHNMGAVQWSAPHTSRSLTSPNDGTYAHCWDGPKDIMCYDDGPNKGHAYETTHCTTFAGLLAQSFDCNRDDYFDPDPGPTSRFATYWNTFDSFFLTDCSAAAKGCGWDGTSPAATSEPVIIGVAKTGLTLDSTDGAWTASPALSRQWQREVDGEFVDIAGATSRFLLLDDAWAGSAVRLEVTAVGTTTEVAHSQPAVVTEDPPASLTAPTVVGTMEHGLTVSANVGTWERADRFDYYWYRNVAGVWSEIAGERASTYTLQSADVGNFVAVIVVAWNTGATGTQRSSSGRLVAAAQRPAIVSAPTLSGEAVRGHTLTVGGDTWSRSVSSRAYEWQRDVGGTWTPIAGATTASYELGLDDVGAAVRARVIATGLGGASDPAYATTGIVVDDTLAVIAPPSFTGTPKVSRQLTGTAGTWNAASAVAHHWERRFGTGAWTPISGADSLNYTLTPEDLGAEVKLVSVAQGNGGPLTSESAPSAEVTVLQPPVKSGDPVLSGTAKRTHTLNATTITWTGTTTSTGRRWERSNEAGTAWTTISGETGTSYTLAAADLGRRIRVVQFAENDDGASEAISNETAPIADLAPPVKSGNPVLSGNAKRTHTLTATTITWTGASSDGRRWERSNEAGTAWTTISGETGTTYTLGAADVGRRIRVVQFASNADGAAEAVSDETVAVADLAPPTKSGDPVLTGLPKPGRTVSSTTITWTGASTTDRRWERSDPTGTSWSTISGETASTYVIRPEDVDRKIRTVQYAENPDGATEAISNALDVVALAPPIKSGDPVLSGSAKRTRTLFATTITWTGATTTGRRWERSGPGDTWSTIAGQTGDSYTLGADDLGHTVRVVQFASNEDGTTEATSGASATVTELAPPVASGDPIVSGVAKIGRTLTATPVTWTGATAEGVRWERSDGSGGWDIIASADAATYVLGGDDVGRRIRAVAFASNDDGPATATSNETAEVADLAPPVNSGNPTIAGAAKRTRTLTATTITWTGESTSSQRWERSSEDGLSWSAIPGATATTYVLDTADLGRKIRFVQEATNADGTAQVMSNETGVVVDLAPPVKSGDPVLSGTAKRTHTLNATTITWTGTTTSTGRRWERSNEAGTAWSTISGETGTAYTLGAADVGRKVRVVQFAQNDDGLVEAISNEVGAVAEFAPPVSSGNPVLTGTAKNTHTLSATTITWTGETASGRRWERSNGPDWETISGATGAAYVLAAADVGRRVRVVQFATNDDGTTEAISNESATVVDLAPPVKSGNPSISGTAKVTRTLTASTITWTGADSDGRRWERSSGTGWVTIAGEIGSTYTLTDDDLGHEVRVVQFAANGDGAAEAISNATATVVGLTPPVKSGDPTIAGVAKRTHTLTAAQISWISGATSSERHWERSSEDGTTWSPISGATGLTYVLAESDVGRRIRFVQSASNADGDAEAISNEVGPIAEAVLPVKSGDPVLAGVAKRGQTLTAPAITWTGETISARRWERTAGGGWEPIPGQTGTSYLLTADDVGKRIRVVDTASNADGDAVAMSGESATVADLFIPVNNGAPIISGTPQPGSTLTATPGFWTVSPPIAQHAYRWQADGTDIAGATSSSFVPTADLVGSAVRVVVTATTVDASAEAASAPATIVKAPVQEEKKPEVTVTPPATSSAPPSAPAPPAGPVARPPVLTAPAPAPAPAPRLALRGKVLLTFAISQRGRAITLKLAAPVKLKRGKYVLTVCVKKKCTRKRFTAKRRTTKLPAVRVAAKRGDVVKATLTGASGRSTGSYRVK